jgi:hypothetical protein
MVCFCLMTAGLSYFSALLLKTCHSFQYRQAALKRMLAYLPFTGVRTLLLKVCPLVQAYFHFTGVDIPMPSPSSANDE